MLTPGPLALLGSGETSLAGGRIFEHLARQINAPVRIAILETPAGFELNSPQVAGRVADYLKTRLANYKPQIDIIPARKKGTEFSPDRAEILAPLAAANFIFMGPGSPTYAIRQLQNSLAWDVIRARHRLGATLVFASAATIAISAHALPVYEIFKVGQDVHAPPGLNLFADYGINVSFIPHWNNAEGGADVDTSRCFIGLERFNEWRSQLPPEECVVGLDEHTGLVLNFQNSAASVMGVSSVSFAHPAETRIHPTGATISLEEIGQLSLQTNPAIGISAQAWDMVQNAPSPDTAIETAPPPEVVALAEARHAARKAKRWEEADSLRKQIAAYGWSVADSPEGFRLSHGN
jgi:subtilisin family serine protease